jgi:hypothetical protein
MYHTTDTGDEIDEGGFLGVAGRALGALPWGMVTVKVLTLPWVGVVGMVSGRFTVTVRIGYLLGLGGTATLGHMHLVYHPGVPPNKGFYTPLSGMLLVSWHIVFASRGY